MTSRAAVPIVVSCTFSARSGVELGADPLQRVPDRSRIDLRALAADRRDREQACEAQRGIDHGLVRGRRVHDAVDVAQADVERREAGRRVRRREDDEADAGIPVPPRFGELLAHRAPRDAPVLALDDDAQRRTARAVRVERHDEVALARPQDIARVIRGALHDVIRAAQGVPEHPADQLLEVGALRRRPRTLRRPRGGRGLDRGQALVEALEAARDLGAELVERRTEPGRVEQERESRRVTVEVGAEEHADAADRGVPALLVEQLVDERLQLALVAQEALQGPRQPPVTVGEVLAEQRVHLGGDALVHGLCLAQQGLELSAHHVHVHRGAGVTEGGETDAERAFDERDTRLRGAARDDRRRARVDDRQVDDVDPVARDPDTLRRVRRRGEGDERGGFHVRDIARVACHLMWHGRDTLSRCMSSSPTVLRGPQRRCSRGSTVSRRATSAPRPSTSRSGRPNPRSSRIARRLLRRARPRRASSSAGSPTADASRAFSRRRMPTGTPCPGAGSC